MPSSAVTLDRELLEHKPTAIYFEEDRRHGGTNAAHVYGGFKAHLEAWCSEHKVPCQGVPGGEIKKSWTGKSSATKDAMMTEALRRGFEPFDANEVSALAILHMKAGIEEAAPAGA